MDSLENTGFDYNMNRMMKAFTFLTVIMVYQAALEPYASTVPKENVDIDESSATSKLQDMVDSPRNLNDDAAANKGTKNVNSYNQGGKTVKMTSALDETTGSSQRKLENKQTWKLLFKDVKGHVFNLQTDTENFEIDHLDIDNNNKEEIKSIAKWISESISNNNKALGKLISKTKKLFNTLKNLGAITVSEKKGNIEVKFIKENIESNIDIKKVKSKNGNRELKLKTIV